MMTSGLYKSRKRIRTLERSQAFCLNIEVGRRYNENILHVASGDVIINGYKIR